MKKRVLMKNILHLLILILIIGLVFGANKYKVDAGSEQLIEKYDGLYVKNTNSYDLFVPAKTESEFYSIADHPPSGVNAGECYGWTSYKDIKYDKICCSNGAVADYNTTGTKVSILCCDVCQWSEEKHINRCAGNSYDELDGPYVDITDSGKDTYCEDSICCESGNLVDHAVSANKARVKCCP